MAKPIKKTKAVNVKMLNRSEYDGMYEMVNDLVSEHHHHLIDARISLAWRYGWTEDQDGRLKLGQAKKLSDFDRELRTDAGEEIDLVILLNFEAWNDAGFTREHQLALLDHELCHFQVAVDEDGETKLDERNRQIYRIRGHDVEEFTEIVSRHGIWKSDLEKFAKQAAAKLPLFENQKLKIG
jgi:hypothetical protein